jgi:hypothetical protein
MESEHFLNLARPENVWLTERVAKRTRHFVKTLTRFLVAVLMSHYGSKSWAAGSCVRLKYGSEQMVHKARIRIERKTIHLARDFAVPSHPALVSSFEYCLPNLSLCSAPDLIRKTKLRSRSLLVPSRSPTEPSSRSASSAR